MFLTKGVSYLVLLGLAAIAGLMFFGFAMVKDKSKRLMPRAWAIVLGVLFMLVSVSGGTVLTIKAYTKIKNSVTALKNFPQTTESDQNRDTTDYVRELKLLEPAKYKGKVPEQYYSEYGFYDWWRFPVVYPYAIYCIDVLDKGVLVNDSAVTDFTKGGGLKPESDYFSSFIFDKDFFVGAITAGPGENNGASGFFIFNLQNGRKESVNTRELLMKKLDELGFKGSREFITTRKYSRQF